MNDSTQNSFNTSINETEYDYYDYEIDSSIYVKMIVRFIPSVIVYALTFLLGVIGNTLVIFAIIRYKKLQSITNMFLFSLATADLLLIIVCVPLRMAEFFTFTWMLGTFLCKLMHYIQNVSAFSSIFNLTAMSLERYFAILHPLRARYICTESRAKKLIVIIWILAFLAASPILIGKSTEKVGIIKIAYHCKRVWISPYWEIFEIYRATFILVLPICVMLFAYISICLELWRIPIARNDFNELESNSLVKQQKKLKQINNRKQSVIEPRNSYREVEYNPSKRKLRFNINEIRKTKNEKCCNKYGLFGLYKICFSSEIHRNDEIKTIRLNSCQKSDDEAQRKQIVKMLICIIIIFFICWAPITVNNLLVAFGIITNINSGPLWQMRMMFHALSSFNSCVNPIVYAFMSKHFREGFKASMKRCCSNNHSTFNQVAIFKQARNKSQSLSRKTSSRHGSSLVTQVSLMQPQTPIMKHNSNPNFIEHCTKKPVLQNSADYANSESNSILKFEIK